MQNFPRRATAVPRGKDSFLSGRCCFPAGKCSFPSGEMAFPSGETVFPSGEMVFPVGEMLFPQWGTGLPQWGNVPCDWGNAISPTGNGASPLESCPAPPGNRSSRRGNPFSRCWLGRRPARACHPVTVPPRHPVTKSPCRLSASQRRAVQVAVFGIGRAAEGLGHAASAGSGHRLAQITARHAASGRRAHPMCSVLMCPWPLRVDFSRRACAEMRRMGRSTSMRRLGVLVMIPSSEEPSADGQGRDGHVIASESFVFHIDNPAHAC